MTEIALKNPQIRPEPRARAFADSKKKIRVDWFRVLVDLKRRGYHPAAVSSAISVARSTILGWSNNNAEPGHMDGERLIALWMQVTCDERDALPLNVEDLLSAAGAKR